MRFYQPTVALCALLWGIVGIAAEPSPQGPTQPICANCHESQWHAIDLSPHGAKNDAQGSMCQACHGDASEHLKDPAAHKPSNPFSRMTPAVAAEQSSVCLACHTGQRHLAFWESSKHAKQDVSCANCHIMHGTE